MSKVAFVKTEDRRIGVKSSISTLGLNPVKNKDVLIKPNFNTADPTPGSTHNDTLTALVDEVWDMGAKSISLGERSYPLTREVMREKGILPLLKQKSVSHLFLKLKLYQRIRKAWRLEMKWLMHCYPDEQRSQLDKERISAKRNLWLD